ncbi:hypothetical protein, partial [Pseudomonas viridiflava]|uniref:hypothetical protein n=1 Tax=Pseudomonas viridiflava TaxID=33069 RepID=UPI00197D2E10
TLDLYAGDTSKPPPSELKNFLLDPFNRPYEISTTIGVTTPSLQGATLKTSTLMASVGDLDIDPKNITSGLINREEGNTLFAEVEFSVSKSVSPFSFVQEFRHPLVMNLPYA